MCVKEFHFSSALWEAAVGSTLCSRRITQLVVQSLAWRKRGGRELTLVKYMMKCSHGH